MIDPDKNYKVIFTEPDEPSDNPSRNTDSLLKPYMAYSRYYGRQAGAVLVVANTAKEARRLAFGHCLNVEDWLDQTVRLIRDNDVLLLADQTKLKANRPHVVDNPAHCQACGLWGEGLTADGRCGYCNEWPGDEVMLRLRGDV
jgi:hypothetical protein